MNRFAFIFAFSGMGLLGFSSPGCALFDSLVPERVAVPARKGKCPPSIFTRKNSALWEQAESLQKADRPIKPMFRSTFSHKDYPQRARRAGIDSVVVRYRLLIDADNKIRDLQILRIRSTGNRHIDFCADFSEAVRRLMLKKSRVISKPMTVKGRPVPYTHDHKIEFVLK